MRYKFFITLLALFMLFVGCGSGQEPVQNHEQSQTQETTQHYEPTHNSESPPVSIMYSKVSELPDGFVYITDVIPDVILEMRYYSTYNFVGARVDDYLSPVAILSKEATDALKEVNDDLRARGYALKVFDAYRPQGAVSHFMRWAKDENDILTKEYFYPAIEKKRIIPDGYVAERSGHSRGSTVDLTIVDMKTGKEVDMGSPFDFFGLESHHGTNLITQEQSANRLILRKAMESAGFVIYAAEWWHYTLIGEPYPDTYFDFPVR